MACGKGWQHSCLHLTAQACFHLLENRYSSELLHEQCSSLFSDTDSVWCRGSYKKIL